MLYNVAMKLKLFIVLGAFIICLVTIPTVAEATTATVLLRTETTGSVTTETTQMTYITSGYVVLPDEDGTTVGTYTLEQLNAMTNELYKINAALFALIIVISGGLIWTATLVGS